MLLSQVFSPFAYAVTGEETVIEEPVVEEEVVEEPEVAEETKDSENPVEETVIEVNQEQMSWDNLSWTNTEFTTGWTTQEEITEEILEKIEGTDVIIENNMVVEAIEKWFWWEIQYNSEEIRGTKEHKNVKVEVYAETWAFEETPTLVIEPLESEKETEIKKVILDYNEDTEELAEEEIEKVAEEKITEVVAFDIKFLDKEEKEIQPREWMVKVEFNYTENETLQETEEHEVKVYHLDDKDNEWNPIEEIKDMDVDKPEITENKEVETIEETNEEQILTVVWDKFSIYTIVKQVKEEWPLATTENQLANFEYGMISISRPGSLPDTDYPIEWFTIMDRNLWASETWTTCNANVTWACGYSYQWWNNYWFPITASASKILTGVGLPWNASYNNSWYISKKFINWSSYDYDIWDGSNPTAGNKEHHDGIWWWANDFAYKSSQNTVNKLFWDDWWDRELRQWPCPKWWHVPSAWEWSMLLYYWYKGNYTDNPSSYDNIYEFSNQEKRWAFMNRFAIPFAGFRNYSTANLGYMDSIGHYWSSSPLSASSNRVRELYLGSSFVYPSNTSYRASGYFIRCFKNVYVPINQGNVYTITLDYRWWKWSTAAINVISWKTWEKPTEPIRENRIFSWRYLSWTDEEFDFTGTEIKWDITLYAKWKGETEKWWYNLDANWWIFEDWSKNKVMYFLNNRPSETEYINFIWQEEDLYHQDIIRFPWATSITLSGNVLSNYWSSTVKVYNFDLSSSNEEGGLVGTYPKMWQYWKILRDVNLEVKWDTVSIKASGKTPWSYNFKAIAKYQNIPENPIREWYEFFCWYMTWDIWCYDFSQEINSNIKLYAKWKQTNEVEKYTELISWKLLNEKFKYLANKSSKTYENYDYQIKKIKKALSLPNNDTIIQLISTENNEEVYARYDDQTHIIYYYSNADKIYLNSDSSYMFYWMYYLEEIDMDSFITEEVENMKYMFFACHTLKSIDLSKFDTSKVTNMLNMFQWCESLTKLDVSSFDTSKVTNMEGLFTNCSSLTKLDVSNFNTSKVTNMKWMFARLKEIKNLDVSNFDTHNVTYMGYMFDWSDSLVELNLSNFNTSKVTNMINMFNWCESLTNLNISSFDTHNVTNMNYMFKWCKSLSELNLSNFNTSKVTKMQSMFSDCNNLEYLDISSFDTHNVTDMTYMFQWCKSLQELNLNNFNTSKVSGMESMFADCNNLKYLDITSFDTHNVTNMSSMFARLKYIMNLDISNFDTSKVTYMNYMFDTMESLEKIYVSKYFQTTLVNQAVDMFRDDKKLVWWNNTHYNSNYKGKERAVIDKSWQPWYFTEKYVISFDSVWGNFVNNQYIKHGNKVNRPINPRMPLNIFSWWYISWTDYEFNFENTYITESIELYAKRKPANLTFNSNWWVFKDENIEKNIQGEFYNIPMWYWYETISYTVPQAEKMILDLTINPYCRSTLQLSWTINSISASFEYDSSIGGFKSKTYELLWDIANIIVVDWNQNCQWNFSWIIYPMVDNPVYQWYNFVWWYTWEVDENDNLILSTKPFDMIKTELTENKTLYAKRNPVNYSVNFHSNNWDNQTNSQEFTYDLEQNLAKNNYVYNWYTFSWWNTKQDWSWIWYSDEQLVLNLTWTENGVIDLYAQWRENVYTIKYVSEEWIWNMEDVTLFYTEENLIAKNKYIRTWYQLSYWLDRDTWLIYYPDQKISKLTWYDNTVITLTAQWSLIPPATWWGKTIAPVVKELEHNTAEEKQETKQETKIPEKTRNQTNIPQSASNSTTNKAVDSEILSAYEWAYKHDVTTLPTLEKAMPDGVVKRGHLAKMVVNYATNILWREIPEKIPSECRWNDNRKDRESDEIKDYAVKSCALWLMWLDMPKFLPNLDVTRAQFGTIMSRLLWWKKYAWWTPYYRKHLNALKENNIMTQIENPEKRVELRQWVWLMLMRSAENK